MRVLRSTLAIQDIWEATAWFAGVEDAELGLRFVDAVETTIDQIASQPGIGPLARRLSGRLKGIRFWRVAGFPHHLVFYQVNDDAITIIRIIHGARKLDEWL